MYSVNEFILKMSSPFTSFYSKSVTFLIQSSRATVEANSFVLHSFEIFSVWKM